MGNSRGFRRRWGRREFHFRGRMRQLMLLAVLLACGGYLEDVGSMSTFAGTQKTIRHHATDLAGLGDGEYAEALLIQQVAGASSSDAGDDGGGAANNGAKPRYACNDPLHVLEPPTMLCHGRHIERYSSCTKPNGFFVFEATETPEGTAEFHYRCPRTFDTLLTREHRGLEKQGLKSFVVQVWEDVGGWFDWVDVGKYDLRYMTGNMATTDVKIKFNPRTSTKWRVTYMAGHGGGGSGYVHFVAKPLVFELSVRVDHANHEFLYTDPAISNSSLKRECMPGLKRSVRTGECTMPLKIVSSPGSSAECYESDPGSLEWIMGGGVTSEWFESELGSDVLSTFRENYAANAMFNGHVRWGRQCLSASRFEAGVYSLEMSVKGIGNVPDECAEFFVSVADDGDSLFHRTTIAALRPAKDRYHKIKSSCVHLREPQELSFYTKCDVTSWRAQVKAFRFVKLEHKCSPDGTASVVEYCENGEHRFYCVCDDQHTGDFCDIYADGCGNNPCQNGGVCTDHLHPEFGYNLWGNKPGGITVFLYNCTCAPGFTGTNCQVRDKCNAPLRGDPKLVYDISSGSVDEYRPPECRERTHCQSGILGTRTHEIMGLRASDSQCAVKNFAFRRAVIGAMCESSGYQYDMQPPTAPKGGTKGLATVGALAAEAKAAEKITPTCLSQPLKAGVYYMELEVRAYGNIRRTCEEFFVARDREGSFDTTERVKLVRAFAPDYDVAFGGHWQKLIAPCFEVADQQVLSFYVGCGQQGDWGVQIRQLKVLNLHDDLCYKKGTHKVYRSCVAGEYKYSCECEPGMKGTFCDIEATSMDDVEVRYDLLLDAEKRPPAKEVLGGREIIFDVTELFVTRQGFNCWMDNIAVAPDVYSGVERKCCHEVRCGGGNEMQCAEPNDCVLVNATRVAVRCCSDHVLPGWTKNEGCSVWGETEGTAECFESATYDEAVAFCDSLGGRLCTADELDSGCTKTTGCGFDKLQIWSSTLGDSCPGIRRVTRESDGEALAQMSSGAASFLQYISLKPISAAHSVQLKCAELCYRISSCIGYVLEYDPKETNRGGESEGEPRCKLTSTCSSFAGNLVPDTYANFFERVGPIPGQAVPDPRDRWHLLADVKEYGDTTQWFWKHQCRKATNLTDDVVIKIIMGEVTDYFKPGKGQSLCEMLTTGRGFVWSKTEQGPYAAPAMRPPDLRPLTFLGGSASDWVNKYYPDDMREFLSFWGGNCVLAGMPPNKLCNNTGGCCSYSYKDIAVVNECLEKPSADADDEELAVYAAAVNTTCEPIEAKERIIFPVAPDVINERECRDLCEKTPTCNSGIAIMGTEGTFSCQLSYSNGSKLAHKCNPNCIKFRKVDRRSRPDLVLQGVCDNAERKNARMGTVDSVTIEIFEDETCTRKMFDVRRGRLGRDDCNPGSAQWQGEDMFSQHYKQGRNIATVFYGEESCLVPITDIIKTKCGDGCTPFKDTRSGMEAFVKTGCENNFISNPPPGGFNKEFKMYVKGALVDPDTVDKPVPDRNLADDDEVRMAEPPGGKRRPKARMFHAAAAQRVGASAPQEIRENRRIFIFGGSDPDYQFWPKWIIRGPDRGTRPRGTCHGVKVQKGGQYGNLPCADSDWMANQNRATPFSFPSWSWDWITPRKSFRECSTEEGFMTCDTIEQEWKPNNEIWDFSWYNRRWTYHGEIETEWDGIMLHSAVYDSKYDRFLIFGGTPDFEIPLHNLWAVKCPDTLSPYEAPRCETINMADKTDSVYKKPPPRYGHTAAWIETSSRLIVFGGKTAYYEDGLWIPSLLNDLWTYDAVSDEWNMVQTASNDRMGNRPEARFLFAGAMNGRLVDSFTIFGGQGKYGKLGDIWTFDMASQVWREVHVDENAPQPEPRFGHQVVIFGSNMFLTGGWAGGPRQCDNAAAQTRIEGCDTNTPLDMWRISLTPSSGALPRWSKLTSSFRFKDLVGHTMTHIETFDVGVFDNQLVVFGGDEFNVYTTRSFDMERKCINNCVELEINCGAAVNFDPGSKAGVDGRAGSQHMLAGPCSGGQEFSRLPFRFWVWAKRPFASMQHRWSPEPPMDSNRPDESASSLLELASYLGSDNITTNIDDFPPDGDEYELGVIDGNFDADNDEELGEATIHAEAKAAVLGLLEVELTTGKSATEDEDPPTPTPTPTPSFTPTVTRRPRPKYRNYRRWFTYDRTYRQPVDRLRSFSVRSSDWLGEEAIKIRTNVCVCANGIPTNDCPSDDLPNICVSCFSGYRLTTAETCEQNMCQCSNGKAASPCAFNDLEMCTSCDAGFHLEGIKCVPNNCKCSNGVPGNNCEGHSGNDCLSCDEGYRLNEEGFCVANSCVCPNGRPVDVCPEHGAVKCDRCNDFYHLNEEERVCAANECACENGVPIQKGSCFEDGENVCMRCDFFYHMTDIMTCEINRCTCADGDPAGSGVCPSHNGPTCVSCEPGHRLEGFSCLANTCLCNHGVATQGPCKAGHKATSCDACNDGYHLAANKTHPPRPSFFLASVKFGLGPGHNRDFFEINYERLRTAFGELADVPNVDVAILSVEPLSGDKSWPAEGDVEVSIEVVIATNNATHAEGIGAALNSETARCEKVIGSTGIGKVNGFAIVDHQVANVFPNSGGGAASDGDSTKSTVALTGRAIALRTAQRQSLLQRVRSAEIALKGQQESSLLLHMLQQDAGAVSFVQAGDTNEEMAIESCVENLCTCDNGIAKNLTQEGSKPCSTHDSNDCFKCDEFYHLVEGGSKDGLGGDACSPNTCFCSNGKALDPCPSHQHEMCELCETGYHLEGGECKKNECACTYGSAAGENMPDGSPSEEQCLIHKMEVCTACDDFFHLEPTTVSVQETAESGAVTIPLAPGKEASKSGDTKTGECPVTTEAACKERASELGLELGSNDFEFASTKYQTKGCYTYEKGNKYEGIAFFGTGGETKDIIMALESPKRRLTYSLSTESGCKARAVELGLELGGSGFEFASSDYNSKGCYTYKDGKYSGSAFFGIGGEEKDMAVELPAPQTRIKCEGSVSAEEETDKLNSKDEIGTGSRSTMVCRASKCECDNGIPEDLCDVHGATECSKCYAGYRLVQSHCDINVCECANGMPVENCTDHLSNTCSSCKEQYHIDGYDCLRNKCVCDDGSVDEAHCFIHGALSCSKCDSGYHLIVAPEPRPESEGDTDKDSDGSVTTSKISFSLVQQHGNLVTKETVAFGSSSLDGYCSYTGPGSTTDPDVYKATGLHCLKNVMDGEYGNDHSWIPGAPFKDQGVFIGYSFGGESKMVCGFAISRDNTGIHPDRIDGKKSFQVTMAGDPGVETMEWKTVTKEPIVLPDALEHKYELEECVEATGVRLLVGERDAIDEFLVFGSDSAENTANDEEESATKDRENTSSSMRGPGEKTMFQCEVNTCDCPHGTPKTGEMCLNHGATSCRGCFKGYYLDTDEVCKKNICECADGTPAEGEDCPQDGFRKCLECTDGYHIDDRTHQCVENACLCENGLAATHTRCPGPNVYMCATCNEGYFLKTAGEGLIGSSEGGDSCEPKQCECKNGKAAKLGECPANNAPFCTSCEEGFHLSSDNTCETNHCLCPGGLITSDCTVHLAESCVSCDLGTPYSKLACEQAAKQEGLSLGNDEYPFAGSYATQGCYTYAEGELKGVAFYGEVHDLDEARFGKLREGLVRPKHSSCQLTKVEAIEEEVADDDEEDEQTNLVTEKTVAFGSSSMDGYCSYTGPGSTTDPDVYKATGLHCLKNVMDGEYGNDHSWIPGAPFKDQGVFIGYSFGGESKMVCGFAISRDNTGIHPDRIDGKKSFQVTMAGNPGVETMEWKTVTKEPIVLPDALEHKYELEECVEATGVRLLVGERDAIDEFLVFGRAALGGVSADESTVSESEASVKDEPTPDGTVKLSGSCLGFTSTKLYGQCDGPLCQGDADDVYTLAQCEQKCRDTACAGLAWDSVSGICKTFFGNCEDDKNAPSDNSQHYRLYKRLTGTCLASSDSKNVFGEPNGEPLRVGLEVLCKYPPYKGKPDDPWFSGHITSITGTGEKATAKVTYNDGDVADGVPVAQLFAIEGGADVPNDVGHGGHRFNDLEDVLASYGNSFAVVTVQSSDLTFEECANLCHNAAGQGGSLEACVAVRWNKETRGCRHLYGACVDSNVKDSSDSVSTYAISTCEPYSQAACLAAAKEMGLQPGGAGYAFEGSYGTKGCYAYIGSNEKYHDRVYFGVDTAMYFRDISAPLDTFGGSQIYRPGNWACGGLAANELYTDLGEGVACTGGKLYALWDETNAKTMSNRETFEKLFSMKAGRKQLDEACLQLCSKEEYCVGVSVASSSRWAKGSYLCARYMDSCSTYAGDEGLHGYRKVGAGRVFAG